jgi:hypothetical protein
VSAPAAVIPVPGPPPPLRTPVAGRVALDNGLVVRTVARDRLPLVDALLIMPAGAAADPPGLAGTASLTAELLDAGTSTMTQTGIATALDTLGARASEQAQWDYSAISLQVLPDQLRETLEVVAAMVTDAPNGWPRSCRISRTPKHWPVLPLPERSTASTISTAHLAGARARASNASTATPLCGAMRPGIVPPARPWSSSVT